MVKRRKQQGAALIVAVLFTSLVATIATSIVLTQQLNLRRTANIMNHDQAFLYALGAESFAVQILLQDAAENKTDHLQEPWASGAAQVIEVDDHSGKSMVGGTIGDLQGKFNLNNLVDEKGASSPHDLKIFQQLLQHLGLNAEVAVAVVDWIDKDGNSGFPQGAEDSEYMNLAVPYRTPNTLMTSPSELVKIKGITPEIYAKLLPHITTLPTRTKINVNTAAAAVIASLHADLKLEEAETIVKERDGDKEKKGSVFATVDDFKNLGVIAAALKKDKDFLKLLTERVDVATEYFLINAYGGFNVRENGEPEAQVNLYTLVKRDAKEKFKILMRGQGSY